MTPLAISCVSLVLSVLSAAFSLLLLIAVLCDLRQPGATDTRSHFPRYVLVECNGQLHGMNNYTGQVWKLEKQNWASVGKALP